MAQQQLGAVLRRIRTFFGERTVARPDRQLLESFLAHRDEDAFAALMARHGRLVLGICRSLLGHEQDAEDAFQATFLVLARKGKSIRGGESVAGWLAAVARRTALRARTTMAVRRQKERHYPMGTAAPAVTEAALREVQAILHEEVARLPPKYRDPFVLCCLEGRSRAEAARELGWKDGTLSGRLAEARHLLESRLARRGVTLSAALCGAALAEGALVPPALAAGAITAAVTFAAGKSGAVPSAAAALAEGVCQAMFATKLKCLTAVLAVVLLLGATATACRLLAAPVPERPAAGPVVPAQQPEPPGPPNDPRPPAPKRVEKEGAQDPKAEAIPAARRLMGPQGPVTFLAISPDGRYLAAGGMRHPDFYVWELASGKQLFRLSAPAVNGQVHRLGFTDDSRLLRSESGDGVVRTWEMRTGKLLADQKFEARGERCEGFSRSGKEFFAPALRQDEVRLWDVASGQLVRRFDCEYIHNGAGGCDFSRDGKQLAVIDPCGEVRVYDLADGKERCRFRHPSPVHPAVALALVAFSPDARTLATAGHFDNTVRLWDARTGKEVRTITTKTKLDYYRAVAFAPDRRILATGAFRDGIHLYDFVKGKKLRALEPPPNFMNLDTHFAFTPDGKTLAVGGDGAVFLYEIPLGYTLDLAGLPKELPAETLDALWKDLASADDNLVDRGVAVLAARPVQALPYLRQRLRLLPAATEKQLEKLVTQLDDDAFATREKATEELAPLAAPFEPALRRLAEKAASLEVRQRISRVLEALQKSGPPADLTAGLHALEALERMGTPEARALLESLASGAPSARLTQEAKEALGRLETPPGGR